MLLHIMIKSYQQDYIVLMLQELMTDITEWSTVVFIS